MLENRQYERAKAKSILVSLTGLSGNSQQITGFLRDISEGGLKIQKISSERQAEKGEYKCEFVLPDYGKIITKVEVLGAGDTQEKFADMLIRMRFIDLAPETKENIKIFIENTQVS